MKKFFTLIAATILSLSAMAEDYNCHLAITSNETPCDPSEAVISINKQDDGKYELILSNLTVTLAGNPITIEIIDVKDIDSVVEDGETILTTNQTIKINALGMDMDVPINLYATIDEDNILQAYLKIPILGMIEVNVLISSEDFGDATFDVNPNFMSINGVEVPEFSADKTEYDITIPKLPEDLEDVIAINDNIAEEDEGIYVCTYYYKENKKQLIVFVNSIDLKQVKTYTFNVTVDPTGISNVTSTGSRSVLNRYNANGQKVGNNAKGLVITRYSDGTAVKSMK